MPAIGVDNRQHPRKTFERRFRFETLLLQTLHSLAEQPDRPHRGIASVWPDNCTEKRNSFRGMLQHDLIGMQRQVQFRRQIIAQARNQSTKIIPARMDDVEIIYITPVMTTFQCSLRIFVQHIEMDIAEQLRCQIADRQSHARRRFQQALGRRQIVPVRQRSDYAAVLDRIAEQNRTQQEIRQFIIEIRNTLFPPDSTLDNRVKQPFVDAHEISSQIEFQDIGGPRIIPRTTANMVFETLDAQRRSFALAAGVTVVNHPAFEQRCQIIEQQMMYYPVSERRSENFPFDRMLRNETDARRWPIRPIPDLLVQLDQIMFQIHLESELALGIAFVSSRIVIGTKNIVQ